LQAAQTAKKALETESPRFDDYTVDWEAKHSERVVGGVDVVLFGHLLGDSGRKWHLFRWWARDLVSQEIAQWSPPSQSGKRSKASTLSVEEETNRALPPFSWRRRS
jgi:hypothetical protein